MQSYVDYDFYTEEYKGMKIPSSSFETLALRSSSVVDYITFNRVDKESVIEEVKFATCAIAEKMLDIEKDGGFKVSESVGKHSVTYSTQTNYTPEKEYYKVASTYLSNTGLLYRGVR